MELLPGDIAIIDGFEYSIVYIDGDWIHIKNYNDTISSLFYMQNQWGVAGSPYQHQIQFIKRQAELPDDIHINQISNDDSFWKQKVVDEFGHLTAKYKSSAETYKNQYYRLSIFIPALINNFREYKHFISNIIKQRDNLPIDWILALINKSDQSFILNYYRSLIPILMDINDIEIWNNIKQLIIVLIKFDNLSSLLTTNVLHWLLEQEDIDQKILPYISSNAIALGDLNIIERLYPILPLPQGVKSALLRGHVKATKWAIEKGLITDEVIASFIYWSRKRHLKILKLLYRNRLLDNESLIKIKTKAIKKKFINILLWLKKIGILTKDDINQYIRQLVKEDNLMQLVKSFQRELLDQENLEYIVSIVDSNQRQIFQWLTTLP